MKRLVLDHTPKCAGTTLTDALGRQRFYGIARPDRGVLNPRAWVDAMPVFGRCVASHWAFVNWEPRENEVWVGLTRPMADVVFSAWDYAHAWKDRYGIPQAILRFKDALHEDWHPMVETMVTSYTFQAWLDGVHEIPDLTGRVWQRPYHLIIEADKLEEGAARLAEILDRPIEIPKYRSNETFCDRKWREPYREQVEAKIKA